MNESTPLQRPRYNYPFIVSLLVLVCFLCSCSSKRKAERLVVEGQEHLADWDLEKAKDAFLEANEIDHTLPEPLLGLTRIYLYRGRIREAYLALSRYDELASPEDRSSGSLKAEIFLRAGKYQQAQAEAVDTLSNDPTKLDCLLIFAKAQRHSQEAAKALSLLRSFPFQEVKPVELAIAESILLAKTGQVREAKSALEPFLENGTATYEAYLALANVQSRSADAHAARASFRKALERAPPYSPVALDFAGFEVHLAETENALEILESEALRTSDFISVRQKAAELCEETKQYERGLTHTNAILTIDGDNPEALLRRGTLHIEAGQSEQALASLTRLAKLYPDSAKTQLKLGIAYLNLGQTKEALYALKRSQILAPNESEPNLLIAGLQVQKEDYSNAVIRLKDYIEKNPNDIEVRHFLGDTLLVQGNSLEAEVVFSWLLEKQPEKAVFAHALARCYLLDRKIDHAKAALQRALEIDPSFFAATKQLATIEAARGDVASAHDHIDAFLSKNAPTAETYYSKALLYLSEDKLEHAEQELIKAIELDANHENALLAYSEILYNTDRIREAIDSISSFAHSETASEQSRMLLSVLLQESENIEEAASLYEKIIESDPDFAPALNNLAYIYSVHLDDLDKAYSLATRARRVDPANPVYADTLGWILYQQGNYKWAQSLLAEAALKLPNSAEIQYHLGMVRYAIGNQSEARNAFEKALATEPAFNGSHECRQRLNILNVPTDSYDADSVSILEGQLAKYPNDTVCLIKLSELFRLKGDDEMSLQLIDRLLEINPENSYAHIQKALSLQSIGKAREAFELAKRAYTALPEDPLTLSTLIELAYLQGQNRWVSSLLHKAKSQRISSPKLLYISAKNEFLLGGTESGSELSSLNQTTLSGALKDQVAELPKIFDYLTASSSAQIDLPFQPSDPDPFLRHAIDARKQESNSGLTIAISAYEKLSELYPDFTLAHVKLAKLYYAADVFTDNSLSLTINAYNAHPDDPALKEAMAAQFVADGRFKRAIELIDELPRTQSTLYLHAKALQGLGDLEGSISSTREALSLKPNEKEKERLSALLTQLYNQPEQLLSN